MTGLAPYNPDSGPQEMGEMWRLKRDHWITVCALLSHPLGWELRKRIGGTPDGKTVIGWELLESQVCKHEADVFSVADLWKGEAMDKGWKADGDDPATGR